MIQKKSNPGLINLFLMNLFKEIFCLALLPMSIVGYFFKRNKSWLISIVIQTSFIIIIFLIRPALMKTYSYAVDPIQGMLKFNYLDLVKMTLPSFALLALIRMKLRFDDLIIFCAFYIPLVIIHIVSGKSYYHYGAFLAYPLIFFTLSYSKGIFDLKISYKISIILLGIAISFNSLSKNLKGFIVTSKRFQQSKKEVEELKRISSLIKDEIPSNVKIIASPGVLTATLTPGKYFYQFGEYSKIEEEVDFILLDLRKNGQNFGLTESHIKEITDNCKTFIQKEVYKSPSFQLIQGFFPKKCWFVNKEFWRSYSAEENI